MLKQTSTNESPIQSLKNIYLKHELSDICYLKCSSGSFAPVPIGICVGDGWAV